MYTSFKSNSHNPKYQKDHHATTTTTNTNYSEISHFSHKQHKLTLDYSESLFKCDGCKELGIGSRYKCSLCDFDLHIHCSIPSPSLFHPFYPKCSFHFLSHPPGDTSRYCNACEKPVKGFLYHCFSCGFDLHPCCAKLPTMLSDKSDGGVSLFLYRKVSSVCHRCGQKGKGWSYRSSCKRYNLHVACVREMVVEGWHERGGLKSIVESGCHKSRDKWGNSKVRKCCEIAGIVIQVIVSAVLGDPTILVAGIMGSLISRP